MNPSPLRLDRHFFSKIAIAASTKPGPHVDPEMEISLNVLKSEAESGQFMVDLTVRLGAARGGEASYTGETTAVGFFSIAKGWPEEKAAKLVEINGASILYGATRELIINLTARGPWANHVLPSISFVEPARVPEKQNPVPKKKPALAEAKK